MNRFQDLHPSTNLHARRLSGASWYIWYRLPYRCLIPVRMTNGRALVKKHELDVVNSCIRMTGRGYPFMVWPVQFGTGRLFVVGRLSNSYKNDTFVAIEGLSRLRTYM
jgi:hypothetical protein